MIMLKKPTIRQKTEIDKWASDIASIGKTFNPDTGKME